MWYAIHATDTPNSLKKRLAIRSQHLKRLTLLQNKGRLLLAGPFPAIDCNDPGLNGFTGSLIIAEFSSLEEATKWAHNDPFFTEGIYDHIDVRPFKKSLP